MRSGLLRRWVKLYDCADVAAGSVGTRIEGDGRTAGSQRQDQVDSSGGGDEEDVQMAESEIVVVSPENHSSRVVQRMMMAAAVFG